MFAVTWPKLYGIYSRPDTVVVFNARLLGLGRVPPMSVNRLLISTARFISV